MKVLTTYAWNGRGLASKIRSRDLDDIWNNFGIFLIDGSLNLISKSPLWLNSHKAIYFNGKGTFFWRAYLNDFPVIISRWAGGCPAHIYEVYSDQHLRSKFALKDGSICILSFPLDSVDERKTSAFKNRAVWFLTWRGREHFVYRDCAYKTLVWHPYVRRWTHHAYQTFSYE